jgi:uncharacterized membrane protein YfcA
VTVYSASGLSSSALSGDFSGGLLRRLSPFVSFSTSEQSAYYSWSVLCRDYTHLQDGRQAMLYSRSTCPVQEASFKIIMLAGFDFLLVGLAAIAAGTINALAGGGTLITFPALLAVGLPAVGANVTNTVALLPGYIGGTLAQANDLRGQRRRLWITLPAGVVGGLIGGILLLRTGEKLFSELVPFLILIASLLLAVQEALRAWLARRLGQHGTGPRLERWSWLPVGLAAIYGGYFGAGLGVITLAALGITFEDNLTHLNALKQLISFSANLAAAIFFLFSGQVVWAAAAVMAIGALLGGTLGGRLAGRIRPSTLRWIVVTLGLIVSIIYFTRN